MNFGEPIAAGNTAEIYLCENRIIKVFNDSLPDTESIYEADKQKYAYSCGLRVPKIIDVGKMNGKNVIIMEYIKGRTIGSIINDDISKAAYYISISVDAQLMMHQKEASGLELMTDRLASRIQLVSQLSDKQKNQLLDKLIHMESCTRLCHGDFHIFNLILNENDVAIIDWVDSSSGNVKADVYRSYLLYLQFSKELADLYLRIYCEKSGLSQSEIFAWESIIAGARLLENVSLEKQKQLIEIIEENI